MLNFALILNEIKINSVIEENSAFEKLKQYSNVLSFKEPVLCWFSRHILPFNCQLKYFYDFLSDWQICWEFLFFSKLFVHQLNYAIFCSLSIHSQIRFRSLEHCRLSSFPNIFSLPFWRNWLQSLYGKIAVICTQSWSSRWWLSRRAIKRILRLFQ